MAQLDAAQAIVDHAAAQSDRWLFLALLVVILIAGVFVVKYLQKSLDTKDKNYTDFMQTVYKENVTLTAKVLVALQEVTELITKNNDIMVKVIETMNRVNETLRDKK